MSHLTPVSGGLAFSTLGWPGVTLGELIALTGSTGINGLEMRAAADEAVSVSMPDRERRIVRNRLVDAGIVPIAVSSYVSLAEEREARGADSVLADLEAHLRLAADLGARGVRVFVNDPTGESKTTTSGERRAIERLLAASGLSAQLGVDVLIETHDSHSTGARVAALLHEAAADGPLPHVRVIWDVAHSWSAGEEISHTFELLRDRLSHVQIKDVRSRSVPDPVRLGAGMFPMTDLVAVLAREHWHGWASLEWERKWHPELPPLQEALQVARSWAHALLATVA